MAAESIDAHAPTSLILHVEALEKQAAGYRAALNRSRWIRFAFLLIAFAFVGTFSFYFYRLGDSLMKPEFTLTLQRLANEKLEKNQPQLTGELQLLANNSQPILEKAFRERFIKDQSLFSRAIEAQAEPFKREMPKQLSDRLNEHYIAMIREHRAEMEQEFPELKSDPTKYTRLEQGLIEGARRVVEKNFGEKIREGFDKLDARWAAFPAAPQPKPGEQSTMEQLIGHLLEMQSIALATGNALAVFDEEAARQSKPVDATGKKRMPPSPPKEAKKPKPDAAVKEPVKAPPAPTPNKKG